MTDDLTPRIKGPRPRGWWWAENAIWTLQLGAHPKLVYLYLRRRAGSDGRCFPSLRLIAQETELSRSTVRRALATLEEQKLLKIKSGQVGKTPNLYIVLRPRVPRGNMPSHPDTPRDAQDVVVDHREAHEGPHGNLLSGLPEPRSTAPVEQGQQHVETPAGAGAHHQLMQAFHDRFVAKTGRKPNITAGAGAQLKRLLQKFGADEVSKVIDRWFVTTDPWPEKCGYSLMSMASQWDRIALEVSKSREGTNKWEKVPGGEIKI